MNNFQQHSRLLDLPTEILARIVEPVIGGQVLHVKLKRDPDHELYCSQREKCWVSRAQGFYLTPCVAQVSEQQAWEDFQSSIIRTACHKETVRNITCRRPIPGI